MTPADERCALCRSAAERRESHIFPKFMVRWIRETSATGRMRQTANLRRRHQDGLKLPLLCGSCEQRFSEHEKWFAEGVFRPLVDRSGSPTLRHSSLLPFVMSLTWRAAQVDGKRLADSYPRHSRAIDRTTEMWRKALLDPTLPAGNHYLFRLPDEVYSSEPLDWVNWYIHRSFDLSAMLLSHRPVLWWKAPGCAGISTFGGHQISGAERYRVLVDGIEAPWDSDAPQVVVNLVVARAAMLGRRFSEIPKDHWDAIAADYRKKLDSWADSPAADLALMDYLNALPDDSEGLA